MKLALSMLCENPERRTGLSTLWPEFVRHALGQYPEVRWVVFAGPRQPWEVDDRGVEVVRDFPANDRRWARLRADHFSVAAVARARGTAALLTVGFMPARTAGLPIVMHVFSLHHRRSGGFGALYRRWASARGLRRASLVIVNSQWTAAQLGVIAAPVLVSPEGVAHERFQPDGRRGADGLPPGYLLWVSNFYRYKRAGLAVAAYARLPAELRRRFPLVMAGGDWEGGLERARQTAETLGVGADVIFPGWLPDAALPGLYRGARAHLLPTAEETFGRSVAEAMACGCPCVLQNLPVLREVAGEAALFVDFTDVAAAAAMLRSVCVDDALVAKLGELGRMRAQRFRFDVLARERVGEILRVLGKARP